MQNPDGTRAPKRAELAHRQLPLPHVKQQEPLWDKLRREEKWAVCGENGVPPKGTYLGEFESALIAMGRDDPSLGFVSNRADSKRQTEANKLTDRGGGGNAKLNLVMDVTSGTMGAAFGHICGNPYNIRDSAISDEMLLLSVGDYKALSQVPVERFLEAHEEVTKYYLGRLADYVYDSRKLRRGERGKWEAVPVRLDLGKFSRILKDARLLAGCHFGKPLVVPLAGQEPGFLHRAIAEIEREELGYIAELPDAFRPNLGSHAMSPYELEEPVTGRLPAGSSVIGVKFSHISAADRFAPMHLLPKTQKGRAGILSGMLGLSYINTYMGKDVANYIIAAVGEALKKLEGLIACRIRKTDSNLVFVVEEHGSEGLAQKVDGVIRDLVRDIGFYPAVTVVDSKGMHSNDARAALALASMGMGAMPTEVLTYVDLLIAAVNLLKPEVIGEVLGRATIHDGNSLEFGKRVISQISGVCSDNDGVRDAEDYVWTRMVNPAIDVGGRERETWRFAVEHGKQFRNALIDVTAGL